MQKSTEVTSSDSLTLSTLPGIAENMNFETILGSTSTGPYTALSPSIG